MCNLLTGNMYDHIWMCWYAYRRTPFGYSMLLRKTTDELCWFSCLATLTKASYNCNLIIIKTICKPDWNTTRSRIFVDNIPLHTLTHVISYCFVQCAIHFSCKAICKIENRFSGDIRFGTTMNTNLVFNLKWETFE